MAEKEDAQLARLQWRTTVALSLTSGCVLLGGLLQLFTQGIFEGFVLLALATLMMK